MTVSIILPPIVLFSYFQKKNQCSRSICTFGKYFSFTFHALSLCASYTLFCNLFIYFYLILSNTHQVLSTDQVPRIVYQVLVHQLVISCDHNSSSSNNSSLRILDNNILARLTNNNSLSHIRILKVLTSKQNKSLIKTQQFPVTVLFAVCSIITSISL